MCMSSCIRNIEYFYKKLKLSVVKFTFKEDSMATKNQKIHGIIHTASAAAGSVGGGLAQIPGADMPVIMGLQTTMIVAIANEHEVSITKTTAADLLLTFAAGYGGRAVSQFFIGWIPGLGNAINATTAIAITETIGWAADAYFAKEEADSSKDSRANANS